MRKRSEAALRGLVAEAIAQTGELPMGVQVLVNEVRARGWPPERLRVALTAFWLPRLEPHCCGEPGCDLHVTWRRDEIADYVRRKLRLRQALEVAFEWTCVRAPDFRPDILASPRYDVRAILALAAGAEKDAALWTALRRKSEGHAEWPPLVPAEHRIWRVLRFQRAFDRGGLEEFFLREGREDPGATVAALRAVRADRTADALAVASAAWDHARVPPIPDGTLNYLQRRWRVAECALVRRSDLAIRESGEDLRALVIGHIWAHVREFEPFDREAPADLEW